MTKKKDTTRNVQKREWLNKEENSRAFSIVSITADNSFSAEWKLGDCSRTVHLDFGLYFSDWNPTKKNFNEVKRDYKDRLNKINMLRDHLETINEEMIEWYHKFETTGYAEAVAAAKEREKEQTYRFSTADPAPEISLD